ncbi:MAG: lipopolysaccharide heptosyltransferase family protein [Pseudomonadota bacterium]
MYRTDCRHFNGYKPCQFKRSCTNCPYFDQVRTRVVIVSLEAMGAVLRSTVLLKPIKEKYPGVHITWITLPMCSPLLQNNPDIDRIMVLSPKNHAAIQFLEFDVLFSVDKSIEAGALSASIRAEKKYGFGLDTFGNIVPFSPHAQYQYDVGLNDELKFKINQMTENEQITRSMGLPFKRDEYILDLTREEKILVGERRAAILQGKSGIIGYNTGCSLLFPYKKFTVERGVQVISEWRNRFPDYAVALLGGPEDTSRQESMKSFFLDDPMVVNTPTEDGLRSGILWMDTADVVLSGCSLGMHIAIGLKKKVVAWFGVSCIQEVDLYDRGVKIQSDVTCSPCWKKSCTNEPKCFDKVEPTLIGDAVQSLLESR